MLQSLQKLACRKRKGAILGLDATNYLFVVIIFVGLGVIGLGAMEGFRIVSAKMEMSDIANSAALYQNLRIDHAALTDPGKLVDSDVIKATESVDGAAHGQFLKKSERWQGSGKFADPWGNQYTISNNQVISQGGVNGKMTTDIDTNATK